MAYDKNKGMLAIATTYDGKNYHYEKIDKYIKESSLLITPDQMQDLDSYVNANGDLKRNVMPHVRSKIEGDIIHCSEETMDEVMEILEKGTKVKNGIVAENKLRVRFYNPKKREYAFAWTYFPDIQYTAYGTYDGYPKYTPTRIAFISYGEKR